LNVSKIVHDRRAVKPRPACLDSGPFWNYDGEAGGMMPPREEKDRLDVSREDLPAERKS